MIRRFAGKPPVGAQINWSHPLSRGLVSAFILNEGAGSARSLVPGILPVAVGTWTQNQTGTSSKNAVVGTDLYPQLQFTGSGTEFSLVAIAVPQNTGGYEELAGYGMYWSGDNGGYAIGFYPGQQRIYCLHQDNNLSDEQSNSYASTVSTSNWTEKRPYHVAVTLKLGVESRMYVDGALETVNTSVGATINYASAKGIVICDNPDAEVSLSLIYNRVLSAAEVQQLYADPYCFLIPAQDWTRIASAIASGNSYSQTLTAAMASFAGTMQYRPLRLTTDTYNATTTWTCPAGVTSVDVECWGGGGGGGSRSTNGAGGGGGGGAYSKKTISVSPGTGYTVTVGAASAAGGAGNDSWFGTSGTVMAKGGNGVANNSATGATGGLATSGVGDTKFSGGNGVNGSTGNYGGGGGSSAGTGAAGANGSTGTGGTAPSGGGNGGNGRSSTQGAGSAGTAPGGGGGGGLRTASGTQNGGGGAAGRVTVTYYAVLPITQTITAAMSSFAGTIGRTAGKVFTASTATNSATLTRASSKSLSGALASISATVAKASASVLSASTATNSATLTRATAKPLSAAMDSFAGVLSRLAGKTLDASTATASASVSKETSKSISAAMSAWSVVFDAALTAMQYAITLTASMASFAGDVSRSTSKNLTGSMANFAGSVVKSSTRYLSGAMASFAGSITKSSTRTFSGTMADFSGAVTRQTSKSFAAAMSAFAGVIDAVKGALTFTVDLYASMADFAGSINRSTGKGLSASTRAASATVTKQTGKGINAVTESPAGTVRKQTGKRIDASTQSWTGAITKQAGKSLAGVLGFTGTLTKLTATAINATMASFSGTLTRAATFVRSFTASMASFAGGVTADRLIQTIQIAFDAVMSTFSGSMSKRTGKTIAATTAQPTATVTKSSTRFLTAITAVMSGALNKRAGKTLGATMTAPAGQLTRNTGKALAGVLTLSGTVSKGISKTFTAAMGLFAGVLAWFQVNSSLPQHRRKLFVAADPRGMIVPGRRRNLNVANDDRTMKVRRGK